MVLSTSLFFSLCSHLHPAKENCSSPLLLTSPARKRNALRFSEEGSRYKTLQMWLELSAPGGLSWLSWHSDTHSWDPSHTSQLRVSHWG